MKTHRMQRWIRGAAVAAALLVLAGSCKKKDAVPVPTL